MENQVIELLNNPPILQRTISKIDKSLESAYKEIGEQCDNIAWSFNNNQSSEARETFMLISKLESKLEHSNNLIAIFFLKFLKQHLNLQKPLSELSAEEVAEILPEDSLEHLFDELIDQIGKYSDHGEKLSGRILEKNKSEFYKSILSESDNWKAKGKVFNWKEVVEHVFPKFSHSKSIEGDLTSNYKAFMKFRKKHELDTLADFRKKHFLKYFFIKD